MPVEVGSVRLSPAAACILEVNGHRHANASTYLQRQQHPDQLTVRQQLVGSKNLDRKLTAAFPPARNISRPHFAARGCVQATIPSVLYTTLLLLGKDMKSESEAGYKASALRGMMNTSLRRY